MKPKTHFAESLLPPLTPSRVGTSSPAGCSSPTLEHLWLRRFVGTWDVRIEAYTESEAAPFISHGSEVARMVGDYWLISEGKNAAVPHEQHYTLGYDAAQKKYIGLWVDSLSSHAWKTEGTVDSSGNILTMLTEGPNPAVPGVRFQFREVTEFKTPDHRVFSSWMLDANRQWKRVLIVDSRRRKI